MFEAHVTTDPVGDDKLDLLNFISQNNCFKLATLYIDKDGTKRSDMDQFMTCHSESYGTISIRTKAVVEELIRNGFVVRRYKIEEILVDSKHQGDVLGILT